MAKRKTLKARRGEKRPTITVPMLLQDPVIAAETGGFVGLRDVELPGEHALAAGPTSARVETVDYDPTTDQTHAPAKLLKSGKGFAIGSRSDPTSNFKLHQVNAWAIVNRTLALLEAPEMLGRSIPWGFKEGRLQLHPHSGEEMNAYYSRESKGLHLQYFYDENDNPIYTALSHDIITHELGHAILDGLKPGYNETTSPDTGGFHEYFGDALAMYSALSWRPVVVHVAGKAPRKLEGTDIVAKIAAQFGSGAYGDAERDYLRNADNRRTMDSLKKNWEEHDYSEVLTGAFYDVLQALYESEVARAEARVGKRKINGGHCVAALFNAARRTGRMMFRAIEYCPPVDVSYLQYAHAVLRADRVAYPDDERGYRPILRRIFRKRRITPAGDTFGATATLKNSDLHRYDIDEVASTPTDAYRFLDANRTALSIPAGANLTVVSLHRTRKVSSGGYYPPREIVLEFTWTEDFIIPDTRSYGPLRYSLDSLWCGGTLVFDTNGNILHYVVNAATPARKKRYLAYLRYLVNDGAFGSDEQGLTARIALHKDGQRVRMTKTPHLRHAKR